MTRPYKNPQVNLRLPEELKQKIATLAESNGRSANAEMVAAIEAWVSASETKLAPIQNIGDLSRQLEIISQRITALENERSDELRCNEKEYQSFNKKPT